MTSLGDGDDQRPVTAGSGSPARDPKRWNCAFYGCAILFAVAALVGILVTVLTTPYSQQQLEQALVVIGAPPGFSDGHFVPGSGGGIYGPQQYVREYDGTSSGAAVNAWWASRLDALGFEDVSATDVSCGGFWATYDASNNSLLGGGPVTIVDITDASAGGSVWGIGCPSGLFG
ncbi:MAG: hypothetical protein ABSE52_09300 [Candidatus Dormibacteria bacterium]|jgi:hypothetical protein